MRQDHGVTQVAGKEPARGVVITATVIVVIATLAVAEIAVRLLLPYNTPDTVRFYSLQYEPAIYSRTLLSPINRTVDLDSEKAWGTKNFDDHSDTTVFINSKGFRGPDFSARKPDDIFRVIVLGGSSVFDHGSTDGDDGAPESWPHLLGRRLVAMGIQQVEVINAGVPGHSASDSLGRLFAQLWMYEPDIVAVYHGWNDIKFWRAQELTPETPLIAKLRPYNPTANPFTNYRGYWDKLLSHSQFYVKIRNRFYSSQIDFGIEGVVQSDAEFASNYGEFGPRQFRLNIELIVEASRSIGAVPVLITQGTLVSADNSVADKQRINLEYQQLNHDAVIKAYQEAYDIIRSVGERKNLMVIEAAQQMNGRTELFGDHVHLTPAGSSELAEILAEQLAPLIRAHAATIN